MTTHDEKRRRLLGRLGRCLVCTTPVLALAAGGAALQAAAGDTASGTAMSEETLLLASNQAEA
uniref:hypothetical protein n=1 Tax=Staphylococcus aureus TaxID=1280 RepID=UPI00301C1C11